MIYAGQALGFVDRSASIADIVTQLIAEFTEARDRLRALL